jgi:hypothetical protein
MPVDKIDHIQQDIDLEILQGIASRPAAHPAHST